MEWIREPVKPEVAAEPETSDSPGMEGDPEPSDISGIMSAIMLVAKSSDAHSRWYTSGPGPMPNDPSPEYIWSEMAKIRAEKAAMMREGWVGENPYVGSRYGKEKKSS